jgi:hypothetical protein
MKKILYFLFLMLPFCVAAQNLRINEIMVRNVSSSLDEGYNFSAWVEVYNAGSSAENLKDYTFSRTAKTGLKTWTPGDISVPAGGFAVVYFERQDSVYYIGDATYLKTHASFKLDNPNLGGSPGTLTLSKGGVSVDEVSYFAQFRNVSYGRTGNGTGNFVYYTEPSKGASNVGKANIDVTFTSDFTTEDITAAPEFDKEPGFYSSAQTVALTSATSGAQIYYEVFTGPSKTQTVDGRGKEPTTASTLYSAPISVSNTDVNKAVVIRAFAVAPGKLPSDVVTATYFVGTRATALPVISITIDDKYMYDNEVGMYDPFQTGNHKVTRVHDGALTSAGNWITQTCSSGDGQYNNPWDRPANFEFFDKSGVRHISQEIDLGIAGQCTRQNNFFKSFKVKAKDKFGSDKLKYDFFASKPGHKYESVMLRFGGTEGSGSLNGTTWFRDGLMSTMAIGYMEVDVQAYQPAVIFINGEYWGMVNIRERTNDSNVYSNFGISGSDVYVVENSEMMYPTPGKVSGSVRVIPYEPYEKKKAFDAMRDAVVTKDLTIPENYAKACELLDIDNFIDNIQLGVFGQNWDWPQNNQKLWRPAAEGGKWRWISYDNDFALDNAALCGDRTFTSLSNGGGCGDDKGLAGQFTPIFKKLSTSPEFKARFLSRAVFHAANTFKPSRLTAMVDSFKNQISAEITPFYAYRNRTDNWSSTVTAVRNYVNSRATSFLADAKQYIGGTAIKLTVASNVPTASVKINGIPTTINGTYTMDYIDGLPVEVETSEVQGYKFKGWLDYPVLTLIDNKSQWKYWSKAEAPTGWKTAGYDDSSWSEGTAPLGYGGHGLTAIVAGCGSVTTIIPQGDEPASAHKHYCTAYFRKSVTLTDIAHKSDFRINAMIDDGAVFYVNGVEVYRAKFPTTYSVTHRSLANGTANAVTVEVPVSRFVEGENVIEIEVHQSDNTTAHEADYSTSNDLYFEAQLTCRDTNIENATIITDDYAMTSPTNGSLLVNAYYEECATCVSKQIYINEVYSAGDVTSLPDWIELYNAESEDVDVSGYVITRIDNGALAKSWTIPANAVVPAGGYLIFDQDETGRSGFPFGISHTENFKIVLTDVYKNDIDVFEVASETLYTVIGESVAHNPDGTGPLEVVTPSHTESDVYDYDAVDVKTIDKPQTVSVYPNPVKEFVTVEASAPISSIVISDISGRVVVSAGASGKNTETLATSRLSSGIYLITVETGFGKTTKKIIK